MEDKELDVLCESLAHIQLLANMTKAQLGRSRITDDELRERLESINQRALTVHRELSALRSPERMGVRAKQAKRIMDGRPNLKSV
ncbi:hypothetical protein [Vibrio parahaemolyticus]|uniref:hypothetical protein n=1 Tax=Vibrio parahaemolyticus TaxID=670 RepID=UPI001120D8AD|nr:hypothetical protein [Vibrio parahaemolyticus]MCZ6295055.1 hypothetical protein [Vibrio parahaemolyticus]MDF4267446.1 hypothetical protein [Vibrio parahaemolyticus]MDF4273034.1 hypothetical protein [Vibrio parahaemolyticus]MDF4297376.1 hypothetical protein [Vibrio parahaemolyticus]TON00551.1 hypothetical protein CGH66_02340 [Vibrio parahaemolyticus]